MLLDRVCGLSVVLGAKLVSALCSAYKLAILASTCVLGVIAPAGDSAEKVRILLASEK